MNLERLRKTPVMRMLMLMALYTGAFMCSLVMAYMLRFDFNTHDSIARREIPLAKILWKWIIPLKLALLVLFRQFEGLLSYFSIPDLRRLFLAILASSAVIFATWFI